MSLQINLSQTTDLGYVVDLQHYFGLEIFVVISASCPSERAVCKFRHALRRVGFGQAQLIGTSLQLGCAGRRDTRIGTSDAGTTAGRRRFAPSWRYRNWPRASCAGVVHITCQMLAQWTFAGAVVFPVVVISWCHLTTRWFKASVRFGLCWSGLAVSQAPVVLQRTNTVVMRFSVTPSVLIKPYNRYHNFLLLNKIYIK